MHFRRAGDPGLTAGAGERWVNSAGHNSHLGTSSPPARRDLVGLAPKPRSARSGSDPLYSATIRAKAAAFSVLRPGARLWSQGIGTSIAWVTAEPEVGKSCHDHDQQKANAESPTGARGIAKQRADQRGAPRSVAPRGRDSGLARRDRRLLGGAGPVVGLRFALVKTVAGLRWSARIARLELSHWALHSRQMRHHPG